MAKYLVETYYTCSFKVDHYLDDINETEIANLEKRDDGKFEILDIKLDNRKTKNLDKNSINVEKTITNDVKTISEPIKPKEILTDANQGFVKKLNEINSLHSISNGVYLDWKTNLNELVFLLFLNSERSSQI